MDMKQIIGGKMYNTDTAEYLGDCSYSYPGDFYYYEEELYRKKTGEFFLAGKGGPRSKYARSCDGHGWSDGKKIIPITEDEARSWVEANSSIDDYICIFGDPEE